MFDFLKNKVLKVYSPIKGVFKLGNEINDPVFSKGMMGETFAIEPEDNKVYAPFNCEVIMVFPTKHALGLKVKELEIIIHVGIDTVNLKGEGFNCFVKEGQKIKKGELLLEVDFNLIKKMNYQTDVIVAINNVKKVNYLKVKNTDNQTVVLHVE